MKKNKFSRNSLAGRLFLFSSLWSTLSIIIAGLVLTQLYRSSVQRTFDDRLVAYVQRLASGFARQTSDGAPFEDPANLNDPRFSLPLSGWYWALKHRENGNVVLVSESLVDTIFTFPSELGSQPDNNNLVRGYTEGPDGEELRIVEQIVRFGPNQSGIIAVAGNATELQEDIAAFQTSVGLTLIIFAIGMILTTLVVVSVGLRPLDHIRSGLRRIRNGEAEILEGNFPLELSPLAREMNALIVANNAIIERARTQVGNLAHALKTPLSVITNEVRQADNAIGFKITEQTGIMRDQVQHYLDRARMAARGNVIGVATEIEPVLEALVRVMNKIHGDQGISVTLRSFKSVRFRGEKQDLEEMAGNLVDNACKWATASVNVSVDHTPGKLDEDGERGNGTFEIIVDDDGPGLSREQMQQATRRGKRLDETKPGSGLGLSIVTDLAEMYGGEFRLDHSPAGGLQAILKLSSTG